MTAPTYHLHPISGGNVYLGECGTEDFGDPVPAVVLTASGEDVERSAIALAAAWMVVWDRLNESSRDAYRGLAKGQIAALLAPPVPPEPSMSDRRLDRDGYEWARSAQSVHWHVLGDIARIGMPWADLWAERGPLREVE